MSEKRTYKQLVLKKRPQPGEMLKSDHFEVRTAELPLDKDLRDGHVLARVTYFSCDPTQRLWASDAPNMYMEPVKVGEPMRSLALARVEKSRNALYQPGDRITGIMAWSEHVVGDPDRLGWTKITEARLSDEAVLGPCGMTGQTAYIGMCYVAKPKPGDKVLISGATGGVGQIACQIAKMMNCEVVGIVCNKEEGKKVLNMFGVSSFIDCKEAGPNDKEFLSKKFKEVAGAHGFDIYWDNIGSDFLEAAIWNIAIGAKIVICGALADYNKKERTGPSNYLQLLHRRARMEGFLEMDFKDKHAEAIERLSTWVLEGKLKFEVDTQLGPIEKAPEILNRLFTGENKGKLVHKLTHDTKSA